MEGREDSLPTDDSEHGASIRGQAVSDAIESDRVSVERRRMSFSSERISLSAEAGEKTRAGCCAATSHEKTNMRPESGSRKTAGQPDGRQLPSELIELKTSTIMQHYYPEGGWGWVICACAFLVHGLTTGLQLSFGVFYMQVLRRFGEDKKSEAEWIGAMSMSCAFLVAPVAVAVCRRKSIRLTAVVGGMVTALGCLFTSFASQMHHIFVSYSIFMSCGLGIARETSSLMIGQYFKRKREFVEVFVQSGTGLGIAIMSVLLKDLIKLLDWRLGLHVVTGVTFISFFLGMFYRPASLYHPQRRAILHLKNQKRKVKGRKNLQDKAPFIDFSPLKEKTLQIIIFSAFLASFGAYTPCFYLVYIAKNEGLEENSILLLQVFLGLAYSLGCYAFSLPILKNTPQCRISRLYVFQTTMLGLAISILSFCALNGYYGYVLFVWFYGIFCGGYQYSLKMHLYEKVRPNYFDGSWGYLQFCQFIPVLIGIPVTGYINKGKRPKMGFIFSCGCILAGTLALFLINIRRKANKTSNQVTTNCTADQNCYEIEHSLSLRNTDLCTCSNKMGHERSTPLEKFQRGILFATSANVVDSEKGPDYLVCISEERLANLGENNIVDELRGGE
ncbi:monocarboxylate transporter 10-like [Limulus polyphemus]|uniref:Monocarboxylate transporter 10-like n=1 Tax=Limulus polyphemus TaxID=6850 RepID=A0ABM1S335_LIMPO|nr:monocarboxylate transporter 10-like [Limulus polyphemus]